MRYREVPPKNPSNQKMLLSFYTQGVPRVPDLQKKNRNSNFFFCWLFWPIDGSGGYPNPNRRYQVWGGTSLTQPLLIFWYKGGSTGGYPNPNRRYQEWGGTSLTKPLLIFWEKLTLVFEVRSRCMRPIFASTEFQEFISDIGVRNETWQCALWPILRVEL